MPAGRPNAKALLQKVNSQLRGERVPLKTKEEDELAVYLQSIQQKTQQVRTVGFEDYGDISISSGVQSVTPRGQRTASPAANVPTPSSNKFLKKKKVTQEDENDHVQSGQKDNDGILIAGKKKVKGAPSKAINERQAPVSALDKANALTKKITSWSSRSHLRHRQQSGDSDSDDSAAKGSEVGRRPGSADTSIGRDGNKFLKSSKGALSKENKKDRRSPSPQLHYQRSLSQEKMEPNAKSTKTKGEIVRTLGSVYLTSEEESLAEFIHGLSASESTRRPQNLVTKKQQKWRKKSPSPSGPPSPSIHMSRSPSPFKNQSPTPYGRLSRSQSQDSDLVESMASEILEIKQRPDDSASSGDRFGVNLMDIASLLPAESRSSPTPADKKQKKRKKKKSQENKPQSSPFAFKPDKKGKNDLSTSMGKKQKESSKSNSKNDFFGSLGIQMVDDIFDEEAGGHKERDNDVSVSDESEIKTEKSDDHRKSRLRRQESVSEIVTELGGRSFSAPKLEDDDISERIGKSYAKSVSYSYDDSGTEAYDDYSETFISESETYDRHKSPRSEHTESSKTRQSRRKGRERRVVVEEKRVDITASDEHGKTHHFNATQTGVRVSPAYGLQYVDPTPVSAHVINSDALEALTAYSPNILALQDMMRNQLELVKSFMEIQNRIYGSCLDGLSEDFQYTTLEDTKEYINKNRKPRMTFDEALKLVDLEEKNI